MSATKFRPPHWAEFYEHVKTRAYRDRVDALTREGLDHSDAEAVADAEWLEAWTVAHSQPVTP